MLVPLGGGLKFVGLNGFRDDGMASAIGLGKWIDADEGEFKVRTVRANLREIHGRAEARASRVRPPRLLVQNIARLGALIGLSEVDQQILAFAVMLQTEQLLDSTAEYLGEMSSQRVHRVVAVALGLPQISVRRAFEDHGILMRSGLLTMCRFGTNSLRDKLNLLSDRFADTVMSSVDDPIKFLRDTVLPSTPGHLRQEDFAHLNLSTRVLAPYLQKCVRQRRTGVNILVHGRPGTGKSQFAKLIASELGCTLFEVSGEDGDGDPLTGASRLRSFRAAQSVLARSCALILFDEIEDVFESASAADRLEASPAKGRKAWINRVLETNPVPTFWLANSISGVDSAFVRRFDMILEFPVPPRAQREKFIREACDNLVSDFGVRRLADCDELAPAVVARAAAVVRFVGDKLPQRDRGEVLQQLVNQTLLAQGHAEVLGAAENDLPNTYDPTFIRTEPGLDEIAQGVAKAGSARICLYGPPGTGKTAWAKWLASTLGRPLNLRRASDLMSKWLGQTEKNIAEMFRRAKAEGAILLIDEVDSFLQERRGASRSWEVTQVNEMLTQMEAFEGIFLASTNLVEGLDEASLRRFDLKVRFDYMAPGQAWALFVRQAESMGLHPADGELRQRIVALDQLTPGDFATVARQHRFRPLAAVIELADALVNEVAMKRHRVARPIGFLSSGTTGLKAIT